MRGLFEPGEQNKRLLSYLKNKHGFPSDEPSLDGSFWLSPLQTSSTTEIQAKMCPDTVADIYLKRFFVSCGSKRINRGGENRCNFWNWSPTVPGNPTRNDLNSVRILAF